jgi:hypothetical protein
MRPKEPADPSAGSLFFGGKDTSPKAKIAKNMLFETILAFIFHKNSI